MLDPRRLFAGSDYEEGFRFTASADWVLDYYLPGPPPVAVDLLLRRGRGLFFEKVVKLQDLRRFMDCRTVIVAGYPPSPDQIRICGASGISIALITDQEGIGHALSGTPCEEVNRRTELQILKRQNRARSEKCRGELLAAFRQECMTMGEAKAKLRWSYSEGEVASQLRALLSSGDIKMLARAKDGGGIYGICGTKCGLRADLSDRCRKEATRRAVTEALAGRPSGMTAVEVAEACGIPVIQSRICLRDLAKASTVSKEGAVWRLR